MHRNKSNVRGESTACKTRQHAQTTQKKLFINTNYCHNKNNTIKN